MKQGASTILLDISDGDPNPNRARHGHGDGEASKKSAVDGGRRAAASTADRPPLVAHPSHQKSLHSLPAKSFSQSPSHLSARTEHYERLRTDQHPRQRSDMSWSTVSVFTPSSHALKHRRVIALIQYYLIRCYNIKLQYIADNNIECLIFIRIYIQQ